MAGPGAQSFSTDPVVGAELAANRIVGISIPFVAQSLVVVNDAGRGGSCAAPVYVTLQSTVGSTSDFYLQPGDSMSWQLDGISSLGLASTTTSTSARARVGAWR